MPGTVVAVAVYVPLAWLDRRLSTAAASCSGRLGLLFTGTILGLIVAYVVRFHALAYFAVDSRMGRIDPALDDAARALGADRARVLADVHLPLLWPGIVTAALLVFVEVMKELPATALLRPLGGDTLAIAVWEATKDSRFDVAALPALLIVPVGLVPVVLAIRLSRGDAGSPDRAERRRRRSAIRLDEGGVPGLVQQETGGVEHVALAQAMQASGAVGGRVPGRDGGGLGKGLEAVGLRLVEGLAKPRQVVGDAAGPRSVRLRVPGVFLAAALGDAGRARRAPRRGPRASRADV